MDGTPDLSIFPPLGELHRPDGTQVQQSASHVEPLVLTVQDFDLHVLGDWRVRVEGKMIFEGGNHVFLNSGRQRLSGGGRASVWLNTSHRDGDPILSHVAYKDRPSTQNLRARMKRGSHVCKACSAKR